MSKQPPIEAPQGAIRLNTDSQKLEFFAQDRWYEMATNTPVLDGGARGFVSGGLQNPAEINNIDQITIPTQGNAIDFGNLTQASRLGGTTASRTRAVRLGGIAGGSLTDTIDFWTISQQGDATDFGDLTATNSFLGGASNSIKGIFAGGATPTKLSTIQSIEIATTGDAVAFGDNTVTNPVTSRGTCSDSHGGLS